MPIEKPEAYEATGLLLKYMIGLGMINRGSAQFRLADTIIPVFDITRVIPGIPPPVVEVFGVGAAIATNDLFVLQQRAFDMGGGTPNSAYFRLGAVSPDVAVKRVDLLRVRFSFPSAPTTFTKGLYVVQVDSDAGGVAFDTARNITTSALDLSVQGTNSGSNTNPSLVASYTGSSPIMLRGYPTTAQTYETPGDFVASVTPPAGGFRSIVVGLGAITNVASLLVELEFLLRIVR